jgi:hypothetical protein
MESPAVASHPLRLPLTPLPFLGGEGAPGARETPKGSRARRQRKEESQEVRDRKGETKKVTLATAFSKKEGFAKSTCTSPTRQSADVRQANVKCLTRPRFVFRRLNRSDVRFAAVCSLGERFGVETAAGIQVLDYAIIALVAGVGAYFGAYLRRKAENRAQREDIENLTELIERVRSEYARQLENLVQRNREILAASSQQHQMRLAVLEERFRAHQQAYTLCRELFHAVHTERITDAVIKSQIWWEENCLYLDADAREAFWRGIRAAGLHGELLRGRADSQLIRDNWKKMEDAQAAIERSVALPPIKISDANTTESSG